MSLKKFVLIQGVGRLAKCVQKGPEFKRHNLIFAENGRGKTTLCAVLRSLETGRHEYIGERATIAPTPIQQLVQIRLDGSDAKYSKQSWSSVLPNLAIFDGTFVAQNVHAGEYVTRDHRTNLLQVILGDVGVALANEVDSLDDQIREKNGEIAVARKLIEATLPSGVKVDAYLKIAEVADIAKQIETKSADLNSAKQSDTLSKHAAFSKVAAPAFPSNFSEVLGKTIEDVSAEAEKQLRQHIEKHQMHARGEAWISEGLSYIKDDACPFCAQEVAGSELVSAYKQYFSDAYAALVAQINAVEKNLASAMGSAQMALLKQSFATNTANVDFWKQHVDFDWKEPAYDALSNAVSSVLTMASSAIATKKAKPLEAIAVTESLTAALAVLDSALTPVEQYNANIATANGLITAKKTLAASANVVALSAALASLQLTQKRFEEKNRKLCDRYSDLVKQKAELDGKKDKAKVELDAYAEKIIGKYEQKINEFLVGFGAGFSVVNTKKTYIGGTATSGYQLQINAQAIELGDASTPLGTPCFRTTLSAGDKSTLALAFFMAKLELDPNKTDRIVVFDDPFNSQDRSRRERTAELLKKYGNECKQLFLLSHDPMFLHLVYTRLPNAERHCVQMSRVPDNFTNMEEWDIEKETQQGYFKDHAALNSYLLSGATNLVDVVRKIRPVLEGYMRYRFPNQFPPNEWLGDMIQHVRKEGAKHPMHPALSELEGINDYSKKYHHDTNPGKADSEIIDDGELRLFAKRTLNLAGGY